MVATLGVSQHTRVDCDLINAAGEVVARRTAPTRVTTNAPVARVVLSAGLSIGAYQLVVDVELHSLAVLLSHEVMPLTVIVGIRRGDGVLEARPHAEPQLTAVKHVDVPVVVARVGTAVVAEPN